MADVSQSGRTKRRKVKRLAEKHLFDVLRANVSRDELQMNEGSDNEFNHDALNSEPSANVCQPTCSFADNVMSSADNDNTSTVTEFQFYVNEDISHDDTEASYDLYLDSGTSSDDASSDDDCDDCSSESLSHQLAEWAHTFNISQVALGSLLQILRGSGTDLPKDPRTLLQTPKVVNVANVAGGSYFYFGVASAIQSRTRMCFATLCNVCELNLHINVDGLPLSRSSTVQLWPILGRIHEIPNCEPFVIGVYGGCEKPNSAHEFLRDFVAEMSDLQTNGIFVNDKFFAVKLSAVICDAPARAFLKCIKGHSGYNACERCTQEGNFVNNRMTFPEMDAPSRTDDQFASGAYEDHQLGLSPLIPLGIGCVTQFPIDYMHLVCLGVVRRMIFLWLQGPLKHRLGTKVVNDISQHMLSLRDHIPTEFSRRPRSLFEVRHWKATEFRQFLLYTGPIVLQGKLPEHLYHCFMLMCVALSILLSEQLCRSYCDYAEELLRTCVKKLAAIYGQDVLVYNVHTILHLAQDTRRYGALDNVSCFPYENYLGRLKRLARKPNKHVSQIVRRIAEQEHVRHCSNSEVKFEQPVSQHRKEHRLGPLPAHSANCTQYKHYKTSRYTVSCTKGNNCFVVNGDPVIIRNIASSCNKQTFVVYEEFEQSESLFSYPLPSSAIGIKHLRCLSGKLAVIDANAIGQKCTMFQHKGGFVAMPLLHLH